MINYNDVRQNLIKKSNEQLLAILSTSQNDYEPSVIPIIKEILIERDTPSNLIDDADLNFQKISGRNKIVPRAKPGFWDKAARNLIIGIILYVLGYLSVKLTHTVSTTPEKPWSQTYEANIYDIIYKTADTLFQDEASKKQFTTCSISKLKSTYPNGLESIPKDSLRNVYYRVGESCATGITNPVFKAWTTEYEKILKAQLMQNENFKDVKEEVKAQFCDCYVQKLKAMYPNGIKGKIPEDVQNRLSKDCADQIIISNWTPDFEKNLKTELMESEKLKGVKANIRAEFCNCYIEKLKLKYPKGITGKVPSEVLNELSSSCATKISHNK
ncbi:hypothetical protein [Mucilaginibacter sp. 10B2]|uniref:hypothetical protein n=1 Tax=Mucilaginibacter sp. 10B2 TaxID=3048574 RepID=UPI002B22892A|nr:hypothetical protein [Mucilaginibacter sp. 10B2]MEB0277195.1 hypothetical protein [Mucilaginibacter sp. 10B2]